MDVFDAVRTVLAIRKYQDKPVPSDIVWRIVEAGRLTASASNRQPWHFIVVQDRNTLQNIGKIAKTGPYTAQAALAIVVAVEKSNFGISDGSRAVQSMILAAWGEGVGSNWVGFLGPDDIKPLLGIPNNLDVLAILTLGYPDQPTGHGKKQRKPLTEVASRERFGQPFE